MKRIHYFILLILFLVPYGSKAQTLNDYNTLYNRIYNEAYSVVHSYNLNNLNPDGTFANVTYPTANPMTNSDVLRGHLNEMLKISRAYQTVGVNYHSPELMNAYLKAWNWWFRFDPIGTNWWWRSIGWTKELYPSFVLMGRDIKSQFPTDYSNVLNYFKKNDWTPTLVNKYVTASTGANTTDVCIYIMAVGIVDQDAALIKEVMGIVNNALTVGTGAKYQGIHADYGFAQHSVYGRQIFVANYGKEYINGIINFLTLTADTYFQLPDNKVKVLEDLFLEGISWSVYRNIIDQNQYGRFPQANNYSTFISQLSKIIDADTPQKPALKKLYDWMTGSSATNLQVGNKMFWRFDFMVFKGANYMTSTRMTSTRTAGCESGLGNGNNNYYTGSGVNYLYVTGKERYDILADQNWRRLPGITAPQKPAGTKLPLVEWGENSSSLDSFAGGVSDGKTGACGFIYSKNQAGETDVKAFKSWFYFNNYYVALGTGITAGTNYQVPYATTVNQVKYNGSFVVDYEGTATSLSAAQTLKPVKSDWAYINKVGYHFSTNTELNYETAKLGSTAVAWIGLDHGNMPVNRQYAYAVYPNVTQKILLRNVENPPYSIFSNTDSIQAVLDKNNNIAQIVYYKAGKVILPNGLGTCQVNYPAIIQLRWTTDSVYISAANPYCETTPLTTLTVSISGAFCSAGKGANWETKVNINMPQNENQGQSITTVLKKLTSNLPKNTISVE